MGVLLILHGAIEMRANGGESAPLARGCENQNTRPIAELEDVPAVGRKIAFFANYDFVDSRTRNLGRHHESDGRIDKGNDGREETCPQQRLDPSPAAATKLTFWMQLQHLHKMTWSTESDVWAT
jgi:hypothetical protein